MDVRSSTTVLVYYFLIQSCFNLTFPKSYLTCSETNYPKTAIKCKQNVDDCNERVMACQTKNDYVKPGLIKSVNHDPEVYNCIRKEKDIFVNFQNKLQERCLCEQTLVCSSTTKVKIIISLSVLLIYVIN